MQINSIYSKSAETVSAIKKSATEISRKFQNFKDSFPDLKIDSAKHEFNAQQAVTDDLEEIFATTKSVTSSIWSFLVEEEEEQQNPVEKKIDQNRNKFLELAKTGNEIQKELSQLEKAIEGLQNELVEYSQIENQEEKIYYVNEAVEQLKITKKVYINKNFNWLSNIKEQAACLNEMALLTKKEPIGSTDLLEDSIALCKKLQAEIEEVQTKEEKPPQHKEAKPVEIINIAPPEAPKPNVQEMTTTQVQAKNSEEEPWLLPKLNDVFGTLEQFEQAADEFLFPQNTGSTDSAATSEQAAIVPSLDGIYGSVTGFFSGIASSLTGPSEAELKFMAIIKELKAGKKELTDEDLVMLHKQVKNLIIMKKSLLEGGCAHLENELTAFIMQYPTASRMAIEATVFTLGFALGGPAAAFAARMAAGKAMENILPDSSPQSKAGKIANGVAQTLGAYFLNGVQGAAVSAGVSVFKEKAPQAMQEAAIAGSVGYLSNQAGVPFPLSLTLGLSSALVFKNWGLFRSIQKDLSHAWKVCTEQPLRIVPEFCVFVKNHTVDSTWGVVKAIKEEKSAEAVTRIAAYALGFLGLAYSIGTLPLTLLVFYTVNKTYGTKYEGSSDLNNPKFREYVVREFNSRETKTTKTLRVILETESEDFTEFCDQLDETVKIQ